jgi:hypothetical protein
METCKDCKYYQGSYKGFGKCYLNPPVFIRCENGESILGNPIKVAVFERPEVDSNDFCFHFEKAYE